MKRIVLAAVLLAALARPLCADMGTPLMWLGTLHLLFGNLVIGIVEGVLIVRIFKTRRLLTFFLLILANYVSAWIGLVLFSVTSAFHLDLYQGWFLILLALPASFLVTIFLEWPFIMPLFRGRPRWLAKSLLASLIAQVVSYAILVPLYYATSGVTLYTSTTLDHHPETWADSRAVAFFLSEPEGDVYRLRLNSSQPERIARSPRTQPFDRLVLTKPAGSETWRLYGVCFLPGGKPQATMIMEDGTWDAAIPARQPDNLDELYSYLGRNGPAVDLRPDSERSWQYSTGFWPIEGLSGHDAAQRNRIWLALETPVLSWPARYATVLPGDQVVFQLGSQICIYDRPSGRIALIAQGRSPVVVLEKSVSGR